MSLKEIADAEGCSVDAILRVLKGAVRKLKRLGAFQLILATVQASGHEVLRAGSLECQGDWIERNIGPLSYRDRFRLQNDGRALSSYRAIDRKLSGDSDDSLDGNDELRRDALLSGERG
jgi:hypothetical protein